MTWCVIPVYNNADTIRDVAVKCRALLEHVVVVDDGSTDTDIRAMFADTDITVLSHDANLGKGQAILTALEHVRTHGGAHMITIDGDGQHDPADIEKFIPLIRENPTSIIVWRFR